MLVKSFIEKIQNLFSENELCRRFFESSPDAIVVITRQGEIVAYNDNALELFGYSGINNVPGNVLEMYCDPSSRGELLSILAEKGIVKDFETFLHTFKGSITANVNVSLLSLEGQTVHIAVIRDITEKREAEERLRKSEEKFSKLFKAASDAILLLDENGFIVDCNTAATKIFARDRKELLQSSFLEQAPPMQPGGQISKEFFFSSMAEAMDGEIQRFLWLNQLDSGDLLETNLSLSVVEVQGRQLIMCVILDISEQQKLLAKGRLDEIRFKSLSSISRMGEAPVSAIYDFALEAAVSITESEIGYIYFVNDDETELTLHSWSRNVMPQCSVENIPDSYRVERTGIWGDAIRLRQPIITNDYEGCSNKKGVPEGHIPIRRHMNVPVFEDDCIVLLAGVGNKESDYTQEDVRQLTMLMEGTWNVVCRKEADEALREAYTGLEREVFDRTEKLCTDLDNLKKKNFEINREIEYCREVEKKLKKSAGRLALATMSGRLGVWEWDISRGKLLWDERMLEIYKYSPSEFDGKYEAWRNRVHPDDIAAAEITMNDAIECHGRFEWEFRIIRPGGEIRHIKASALAVEDSLGQIQSMIGINRDVTERRRLESRLRRFEGIISVTPDLVSLVDSNYRYMMVNDSYVRSFGRGREYFVNRELEEVLGRDVFEKYSKPMIDAAFAGVSRTVERWLQLPVMGDRYFSVTYQLVYSNEESEKFVAIVAHDITEVKMAEEDRKRIFELSLDMVGVVDFYGRFIELNPAWQSTVGWTEEDLKGGSWIDFVHPDDKGPSQQALKDLFSGQEVRNFENRFRHSGGGWNWLSWNLNADMERAKITMVARDVSEQKKMVEELKKVARTDGLTGANNRRYFLDRAKGEVERIKRYGGSLCLMMIDIDRFKNINDSYGHDSGDKVLKALVTCVLSILRTSDLFGRIGGKNSRFYWWMEISILLFLWPNGCACLLNNFKSQQEKG